MKLDVIVPTFNRAALVARTLDSLKRATIPSGLETEIFVVDNRSTDNTAEIVRKFAAPFSVHYLYEARPGKSHALNTGLRESRADFVGFIDDDEEIDANWFAEAHREFTQRDIDFLGGPYYPIWQSPPPAWLPRNCYGLVGSITEPSVEGEYGPHFAGMLMGGNAVIRRQTLDQVGPFCTDPHIMRAADTLASGEDREMYERLLKAGARGRFSPNLIVHHHIPDERLTMRYIRRRIFAQGVSRYFLEKTGIKPAPGPTLFGVPRWYFSKSALGVPRILGQVVRGRSAASVEAELTWIELAGRISAAMRSSVN